MLVRFVDFSKINSIVILFRVCLVYSCIVSTLCLRVPGVKLVVFKVIVIHIIDHLSTFLYIF